MAVKKKAESKKPSVKKVGGKVKPKKGPSRPPVIVTKAILKKVEKFAARGLTTKQIAHNLGWGPATYFNKRKEYPELAEAFERGKASGVHEIANALFKNAKDGDTQAQKYYLNNRDSTNWKEKRNHELSGPSGGAIQVEEKTTITHEMSLTEASKAYASEVLSQDD